MIKSLIAVVVVGALGGVAANYMTTTDGDPAASPMLIASKAPDRKGDVDIPALRTLLRPRP